MNAVRHAPTAWVAALTLVIGFVVAEATGIRAIGGVVLVLGCGWCAYRWVRTRGLAIAVLLTAVFLLGFALSHPLAGLIGTWPSVLAVAIGVGGVVYGLGDRPATATTALPR